MYMFFRIAKLLTIQVGADMRFYTKFYGLDYSPSVQQYAVQDANLERQKVGGKPIVDVYLNSHLKHFRFYFMARHVAGGANSFYAPYYGTNPLNICFGLSWNFIN